MKISENTLCVRILGIVLWTIFNAEADTVPISSAAKLNEALWDDSVEALHPFSLHGIITEKISEGSFVLEDLTGCVLVHMSGEQNHNVGDIVEITGHLSDKPLYRNEVWAQKLSVTGHTNVTPVAERPLQSLHGIQCHAVPVITTGFVEECFRDEVDSGWFILILRDGSATLPVSVRDDGTCADLTERIFGHNIRLKGICIYNLKGERRFTGLRIVVNNPDALKVLDDGQKLSDTAPPADFTVNAPEVITSQGRRSVTGTVLVTWRNNHVLLKTAEGHLLRVDLVRGQSLPPAGSTIEATGNVETDLFRINLSHARIRLIQHGTGIFPTEQTITTAEVFHRGVNGKISIEGNAFGKIVKTVGKIISLPQPGASSSTMEIRTGEYTFPVDIGNCQDITVPIGTIAEVTGVCIFETENWTSGNTFPPITGIMLVPRGTQDIRIIDLPSWWTTERLKYAITALIAVLGIAAAWLFLLHRIIERRRRELEKEIIARLGSDFKAQERTRLAVELHDAISQNLTGVALELKTSNRLASDPSAMHEHLSRAERILGACREELKNCIWDLRNSALDCPDLNEAVRKTLEPHLCGATLITHISVPRERLTENTAHALLRIIRELATNAVRHGAAKTIRVAGCVENGKLRISVRDDGCGFDPKKAPGFEEGHFGLDGIRERVEAFEGELAIESSPGNGTRTTVTLNMPDEEVK